MRALWILLVPAGPAWAADADGDGCEDAYFSANGACVHPSASVDPGATVGAGAIVGAGALVGPGVDLGASVVIAPRATLVGANPESRTQRVGDRSAVGRRARLGADATLGDDTTLARAATAGARLSAGVGANVGYGAVLGDDVTLGAGAAVGNLAQLGAGTGLGEAARVGRGANLGAGVAIAAGAQIGPEVRIVGPATIGADARVRRGASLGAGAVVGPNAIVGRDVEVGANATVGARAVVRASATLEPYAQVAEDDLVPRGGLVETAIATIVDVGGARQFSDGSLAASCERYRRPADALHTYAGLTGDGLYRVDPTGSAPLVVQCDMANHDGGWTLVYRNPSGRGSFVAGTGATGAVGDGAYKLSDAAINALRVAPGSEGVLRVTNSSANLWFRATSALVWQNRAAGSGWQASRQYGPYDWKGPCGHGGQYYVFGIKTGSDGVCLASNSEKFMYMDGMNWNTEGGAFWSGSPGSYDSLWVR